MKTLVRNTDNTSPYIFADDATIVVGESSITTPDFMIGDLNSGNATLVEDVTPPADWKGNKYCYTEAGGWVLNPQWVDPADAE